MNGKIKKLFIFIFSLSLLFGGFLIELKANNDEVISVEQKFYRAVVLDILSESKENIGDDYILKTQIIKAQIRSGNKKGEIIEFKNDGITSLDKFKKINAGDKIILVKIVDDQGEDKYFFQDYDRILPLLLILLLFIVAIIYFGRKRGLGAILGLSFSIFILIIYIIPQIIGGASPIRITLIGSFLIASGSLFLSHGFNRRTAITWLSTITTLTIAIGISTLFIDFASLFGQGSEEAFYLQIGDYAHINLRGLLLAGIIIGTLGVLDDVTATQTAVVWELKKANSKLKLFELYKRSLKVGREHIASLVNTLALAYAGASLPLFILLYINKHTPFWLKINSEPIAEEIIRTIVGSSALILAVPISSLLAAYFINKIKIKEE